MKCMACEYEHESGLDENGVWIDGLKGDEEFMKIQGSTFKRYIGMGETEEITLVVCPKCGTVKVDEQYL